MTPRVRSIAWLSALLAVVGVVALLLGAVPLGPADLVHMVRWRAEGGPALLADSVLWSVRLPRVLAGATVGSALAVAGAALQGTTRNEMSDPFVLGIVPAAGLGAVGGIALSSPLQQSAAMLIGATLAGAVAAVGVRWVGNRVIDPQRFLLVGVALSWALVSLLGAVVLAWGSPRVPSFTFWVFGGLGGSTWPGVSLGGPVVVLGIVGVVSRSRVLDLLSLGEAEARHLGVSVGSAVPAILAVIGVLVGAAVALAGAVGFVGLAVPVAVRRLIGPSHRWLLPASALGGAILVVVLDTAARTMAAPVEIPLGLLTALVGAPMLVFHLSTSMRP